MLTNCDIHIEKRGENTMRYGILYHCITYHLCVTDCNVHIGRRGENTMRCGSLYHSITYRLCEQIVTST